MADDSQMNQDEIEQLLNQSGGAPTPADDSGASGEAAADQTLDQSEIESLMGGGGAQPEAADAAPEAAAEAAPETTPATATATESESSETPPADSPPPLPDADKLLAQDDIERLLEQSGGGSAAPAPKPAASQPQGPPQPPGGEKGVPQADIDYLLNQAERALESIDAIPEQELPDGVAAFRLEEFTGAKASRDNATLDLIRDVELEMEIELGRTHMYLEDVIKLRKGSVVPLDKLAGDPVDIYVNGRLIARGEVLVLNDNFCVRVAELIAGVHASA